MESIGEILKKRGDIKQQFDGLVAETLAHPEVKAFIAEHKLSTDEIQRSYSKFYEYVKAKAAFDAGEDSATSGYEPKLVMNQGYADVSYKTTAELAALQENQSQRRRVQVIGLPKTMKDVRWKDVLLDDKSRIEVYQAISNFIAEPKTEKGLYVYGDFGTGKSYMMAAMATELAKKGITTTLIHYPTFVLGNNFDTVIERAEEVKRAEVLVLDDIGGETNNAWIRDSILQVILQHRMQEDLPTFFTSNLSMEDLTQHLAETKRQEDIWPAQRVMERIKYLARELRLEGGNRRHG
ncbi:primosomal protein DnaI [Lactococcus termiticola]|uniref:Primosomal protein DnaI n=1 Tax=Lactococcus termiticola TaxID=2169526 RepID=A0A2R5HF21_9LACT|nr:primosomal protein DnaI [Lactococcus termiticola]GBG96663.1 primosomal protein DnaI [Lactococcus termiticola]